MQICQCMDEDGTNRLVWLDPDTGGVASLRGLIDDR